MLKKLLQSVQNKRRGMLMRGVCILHDNACLHTARATHELLQFFKLEVLAPPPQSPDLAPSDCHLFSKLKESLAGKTFADNDEVEDAVMTLLREHAGDFYDAGIKKFVPKLTKCIAIHGYVEKQVKVCCKSESKKRKEYKYFLNFVSLLSK
jgi:histone-lysine N-methyltransferase SETMAR